MAGQNEQKIEVRPTTLNNLMAEVASGRYRIPQFQREYVWKKAKVVELFDSIYQEFPIGSFFIWRAGREHNDLFRHSVELGLPAVRSDDDIYYILDGQQRITSLYVTLNGMKMAGTDYARICFDLKDQRFGYQQRGPDNQRFVAVCDVWGPKAVGLMRQVDEAYVEAFERIYQTIKTYPISLVEVRDKDLPSVCKIFQRINQAGKRLDRFDLISAMTFTKDFDLRERLREDIQTPLVERGFGPVSAATVTQLMALLKHGACTERHEYNLRAEDITSMWRDVKQSVLLAADTLRKSMGVMSSAYVPYDALLTLLAYTYAKSQHRSLSAGQMKWVERWFWRASFSEYYGSGGPTKMGRDRELLDQLLDGNDPQFEPPLTLTVEKLVGTRMTWTRSAVRNAFLCLLANRGPVHLLNNTALDLVNGSISDFTSAEKHHIFPQAHLRDTGVAGPQVHALPNFCFLPGELNRRISGEAPSTYIKALQTENTQFDSAATTHLIPIGDGDGLASDDYLVFLRSRASLLLDEVHRLCGVVSTPRVEERHDAVQEIEVMIRDLIDAALMEADGESYWKHRVPEAVRLEAERRIAQEVDRTSGRTAADFASGRDKLNFCSVMDYVPIVIGKANWPQFEPYFSRKDNVQQHFLAFSEYRNAVAHGREMTEYVRLGGERAMIWMQNALACEADNGSDDQNDRE